MFGLMRNCYAWAKKRNEKNITLCFLGLDFAGKTTTLHRIKGHVPDVITPTWGFASEEFQHGSYKLNMFDLGGGKNIRGIWENYYAEAHGVIFVIDSAAAERLEDARAALVKAVSEARLAGKPILILANKQDLPQALKADEIAKRLRLNELTNVSYRILGCSALKEVDNLHQGVLQGLQWLVSTISSRYTQLSERVIRETNEQREREKREQEEKKKRVEAAREERRKKREAEEAAEAEAAKAAEAANSTQTAGNPTDETHNRQINQQENHHAIADAPVLSSDSGAGTISAQPVREKANLGENASDEHDILRRVASAHESNVNPSVDISLSLKETRPLSQEEGVAQNTGSQPDAQTHASPRQQNPQQQTPLPKIDATPPRETQPIRTNAALGSQTSQDSSRSNASSNNQRFNLLLFHHRYSFFKFFLYFEIIIHFLSIL
eukprot:TRINITY_DN2587_c0_g1_i2.p1 TRINITY_DN2587_c0_g1~~TRINITY_DN2587_c0_g1_i2.p1  ORF type:complete len:438 (+),score=119.56 TRINITY_DN2587_c0_g1_i2:50-1363(+)